MAPKNTYGLGRYIPADVRKEVRKRSKFGCVVCRAGVTEFEHIDPPFAQAKTHDPDRIALLCSSCHAKVTRGHLSKGAIASAYAEIAAADPAAVPPPNDTIDLSSESAKLFVGGFSFSSGSPTILRYKDEPLIQVVPAIEGRPFGINAKFFDSMGKKSLEIEHNVWVGPRDGCDFSIHGNRIKIKDAKMRNSLTLRFEPPHSLFVEHLDMKVGDFHILANENRHAIGKHDSKIQKPIWYYCAALPQTLYEGATVFDLQSPESLEARKKTLPTDRKFMESPGLVLSEFFGVGCPQHGIVFCSNSGFSFFSFARGRHTSENARSIVFKSAEHIGYLLSAGGEPLAYDVAKQATELPKTMKLNQGVETLLDWSAIMHPDLPWPR